jgi:hypothetical protein
MLRQGDALWCVNRLRQQQHVLVPQERLLVPDVGAHHDAVQETDQGPHCTHDGASGNISDLCLTTN